MPDTPNLHPYDALTPDAVQDALSALGLWGDGRLQALSSYENRVYQAGLDEPVQGHTQVVLKFYRPARWSEDQILEEHAFAAELAAAEVPVVAPLLIDGRSLHRHGDCHPGNILWTPEGQPGAGPHFVDLDDARSGPAVQDLWMLLSGERRQQTLQLSALLDGYEQLRDFDRSELALIEPLRTLRLVHYSAWIARRWEDPAFPVNFPWFGSRDYWQGQVDLMVEQIEAMQAAPLQV